MLVSWGVKRVAFTLAEVLELNRDLGENTLIGISRVPCCLKGKQDYLHIGRFDEN